MSLEEELKIVAEQVSEYSKSTGIRKFLKGIGLRRNRNINVLIKNANENLSGLSKSVQVEIYSARLAYLLDGIKHGFVGIPELKTNAYFQYSQVLALESIAATQGISIADNILKPNLYEVLENTGINGIKAVIDFAFAENRNVFIGFAEKYAIKSINETDLVKSNMLCAAIYKFMIGLSNSNYSTGAEAYNPGQLNKATEPLRMLRDALRDIPIVMYFDVPDEFKAEVEFEKIAKDQPLAYSGSMTALKGFTSADLVEYLSRKAVETQIGRRLAVRTKKSELTTEMEFYNIARFAQDNLTHYDWKHDVVAACFIFDLYTRSINSEFAKLNGPQGANIVDVLKVQYEGRTWANVRLDKARILQAAEKMRPVLLNIGYTDNVLDKNLEYLRQKF